MIKYKIEDGNNSSSIFLIDDEYNLKILVAVIFDIAHARIILRKLNEYIGSKIEVKDNDPFLTDGLARIIQL